VRFAQRAVLARAAERAPSGSSVTIAFSTGFSRRMRAEAASSASSGESAPLAKSAVSSVAPRSAGSI